MSEQYRDIRKEINLIANVLKQIEQLMRDNHYRHFSPFVRDRLLMTADKQLTAKEWFSFWKTQKLEQIGGDVHGIMTVARVNNQVTQEHVSIILTCVQDLIFEVSQIQPLSREFREKYIG